MILSSASNENNCCDDWCGGWQQALKAHTAIKGHTVEQKCLKFGPENLVCPWVGFLYVVLCHDRYSFPCPRCLCERTCCWDSDALNSAHEKGAWCGCYQTDRSFWRGAFYGGPACAWAAAIHGLQDVEEEKKDSVV